MKLMRLSLRKSEMAKMGSSTSFSAVCTMRLALAASLTLSVLATAWPPSARISSTTRCAGPASWPSPVVEVPMSFTTTLAPSAAIANAMSRPMPPPAPVTTTTLPSTSFCMIFSFMGLKRGQACRGKGVCTIREYRGRTSGD